MNMSISSLVVLGMPTTLVYNVTMFVPPYFVTHFSITLFLYGTISLWIFLKLKLHLPSMTIFLATSLTNLSLSLTPRNLKLINYSCSQKPINDLHLSQVGESCYQMKHHQVFIRDETCFPSEIKHLHFNETFFDYTTQGNNAIPVVNNNS